MKFLELLERVKGRGVVVREVSAGGDPEVLGVGEDSRKVKAGDVFVARGGTKVDGARFVAEAVAKGAVAVVGEHGKLKIENSKKGGVAWAGVEDVNLACAVLAHEVAGRPTEGMKMIGITGTKGKTTVAYLLRSVLKAAGHKVGMIGTVEIDFGGPAGGGQDARGTGAVPAEMTTPGSVELVELFCRMRANGVTHCVMEVSSHALHQRRVAGIDWAVAIFTNLTGDHLDYHLTMEEYAAAKAMLFEGLGKDAVAVVNGNDKWVGRMVEGCRGKVVPCTVVPTPKDEYPTSPQPPGPPDAGWAAMIVSMTSDSMRVHLRGKHGPAPSNQFVANITTRLVGRHNASNLLAVVAAVSELEVWPDGIYDAAFCQALEQAVGAPGRLQRVATQEAGFQVFVDYAHTHDALENVLTALRATMGAPKSKDPPKGGTPNIGGTPMPRLICLFGCGGDRDRTKRPKMGAVAERLADVVIVTSDNPRTEDAGRIIEEICAGFSEEVRERLRKARGTADEGVGTGGQDARVRVEPDRRAAIKLAIGMARAGDVVLLAGKGHENYQIIGTVKHHFDDVEETQAAIVELFQHQDTKTPRPPS